MHNLLPPLPLLQVALSRKLVPPHGGSARLARALASGLSAPATTRFRPTLAAAAAFAMLAMAALPLRTAIERHDARQRLDARLVAAVAEAGRLGPEVRIDGARVQPLPSAVPGVHVYRIERQGR